MSLPVLVPEEYSIGSLDLADIADCVILKDETGGSFIDPGVVIPGRDGVAFHPNAPWSPLVLPLTVYLLDKDPAAHCVTHPDGRVGHLAQHLSRLKAALSPGLVLMRRTVPHIGEVRTHVKQVTKPMQPSISHRVVELILTAPTGSWQDNTESLSTGNPPATVTTFGDRTIFDPRLSLSAAGTYSITTADGTIYTVVASAGPTYPVVIDVGAGTVVDNAAADARGDVSFSHPHWFRLSPNHTHIVSSTATCTVFWRNRWA